jgi:hypothetical protein
MRVFQNFCKLTFSCHPEDEVRRISSFDFLIKKKNMRFFASIRMTIWIFGTASVLNFTLCSHDDKKLISSVFPQHVKNPFFHFLKQKILRFYSFRTTDKVIIHYSKRRISYFLEFSESLITIYLVSE